MGGIGMVTQVGTGSAGDPGALVRAHRAHRRSESDTSHSPCPSSLGQPLAACGRGTLATTCSRPGCVWAGAAASAVMG